MRSRSSARSFLALLVVLAALSSARADNPVYQQFNQPIRFDRITRENIADATRESIERARASLKVLYAVPATQRTFGNTMGALDDLSSQLFAVTALISLLANAHPDEGIRNQCNEDLATLGKYANELGLDEELYRAVREFSTTGEARGLTGYKKKFLDETLRDFQRSGVALPQEKRERLKAIQDRLAELGISFSRNIADYRDSLVVSERDMAGLPADYATARKNPDGTYTIGLSYPDYVPFMKYATSEQARKALYLKYTNRASPANLGVLDSLIMERRAMVSLLGYPTFAAYQVENRMVKTPKTVWDFEHNLIDKLKVKARRDYDELLSVKRERTGNAGATTINPWEASYYNAILLKEKYQLDQQHVKEYFELNTVVQGLFAIAQHLFNVRFEEVDHPSVWHPDVRMFNVKDGDKVIGIFYLDLYPRPNKFTHAACFGITKGHLTPEGYQIPSASLECNFPRPEKDHPALMLHSEVETFFHEFGHVLHNMLTASPLYSYAGTSVSRDFVEAPSQIFENWCWNYEALSLFAKHATTGKALPRDLFDRMLAAKNVGSGLGNLQQVFYGILDMTYHDGYDPGQGKETTTQIVRRLQNSITLYPYLEGTHFQAAFGHLTGYAAGYYGYLWSEVYAQDMFSVFEKNGVMDQATGLRYRKEILAKGGTEEELTMVKNFLQRDPNPAAFFRSLGLDDDAAGGGAGPSSGNR